jgi:hypothetical protein
MGVEMNADRERLLIVLKFELRFLELSGYDHTPKRIWHPRFIFADSPTCPTYLDGKALATCQSLVPPTLCPLYSLVPTERRANPIPCRHIVLNNRGETVDSLFRSGRQLDLEHAIAEWLRMTIQRLESERVNHPSPKFEKGPEITAPADC